MTEEQRTALVIDVGADKIKAGFAGDDTPRAVFSTVVGRRSLKTETEDSEGRQVFVGDEAENKSGILNLTNPIENGIVTCWDSIEKISEHTFIKELRVAPEDYPVLLTEAPVCSKADREKFTRIMFENFSVPAMYLSLQSVLTLYASGRTSGLVLDAGECVSYAVPIYDGYALAHGIKRLDLAGRGLTKYLVSMLRESGYSLTAALERDVVRDIKEKLTYVALDYDAEMTKFASNKEGERAYELPDGRTIRLTNQRFRCPEALFNPSLAGHKGKGLHETAYDALAQCIDMRRTMYGHIVMCGGSTMFPGIQARVAKEMAAHAPPTMPIKVFAPPGRVYSAWVGGSILASLPSFQSMWMTREDYGEFGPTIVHRRCF